MPQVNIHDAKTHLSRLLVRVQEGEEIVIAKNGRPVAVLRRYDPSSIGGRVLGRDEGSFEVPDDFDAPLPDDILESFLG